MRKAWWYPAVALFPAALLLLPQAASGLPAAPDTPLVITYTIDGTSGTNDWYRGSSHGDYIVLHWSVTPASDIVSSQGCDPAIQIPGPNTGTTRTCSATNSLGETTTVTTRSLKVDMEPPTITATPSRQPNAAGWFNAPFAISWPGSDATSGIASCTSTLNYSGPQTTGTTETGTCTDNAGNSSSASFLVKYDSIAPTTTATPSRSPNGAGWYRAPLSVSWSGSDAGGSGVASCRAQVDYSGPDTTGTNVTGTCTDNAGNSSSAGVLVKYDATAPVTSGTPTPAPNANGWFKAPLSIAWTGADATSGIASCSPSVGYSGPDTTGTTKSGTCTDNAGNTSSAAFVVKYDTHAPTTVATPSRPPNAAGWYNAALSISWAGSDPGGSGIDSCQAPVTYSGPDTTATTRSGTCSDKAGNSSSDAIVVRYDATAPTVNAPTPSRGPDHDGWYNHPLPITWSANDVTSGIASCTTRTYSGPDNANATATGSCTDAAGNSASRDFALEYDATGPTVTVTPARPVDHGGWYNHPVAIGWSGTDATSGIASCTPTVTYSGPDSSNASSGGGCTDHAGNSASPSPLSFKYDATPPVTAAAPARGPDKNGWYNHPVAVGWTGTDPISGVDSCTSLVYSGPDTGSDSRLGTCTDKAGNISAPVTWVVHYDSTAPGAVAASADRGPDHDGWYNHPVGIHWSGKDGLAGIASCSSVSYAGPETARGTLSGRCTDLAGNVSPPVPFALSYDSTPPSLEALGLKAFDDLVRLQWKVAGADQLRLARSPGMQRDSSSEIYSGDGSAFADRRVENYVRYRYTLTAIDQAGNMARRVAFATPMPTLYAPRPGARLRAHSTPLFAWRPAKNARYYNLQLWLKGRKVGSWWPTRARLRLPSRWQLEGRLYRLEPGSYSWYVWPGRGPRRLGRYGPLLGKGSFLVGR